MGDEEKEASKITLRFGFSYYWGDIGAIYLERSQRLREILTWERGIKSAVLNMLSLKYLLDIQM